ncbi:MAG: SMP-30/gluconolactonase/LRE family protein [Thermoanaerobaculia bacterium]|nr:SMP-30/gluconolactonase/LRE family protein [Thermoanaerobaculia bacterium]
MKRSTSIARLLLAVSLTLAVPGFGQGAQTLILFDPSVPETPESIVFDRHDNAYVTLALTGEIRKIAPDFSQTSLAFLPIDAPCGPQPVVALGLALDRHDRLYVAVSSCNAANQGIWRVDTETGAMVQIAQAPSATVLNGIDVHNGWIYAADTFDGLVWRAPIEGGNLEIWADDPLLERPPAAPFPGPNGLEIFRGEVYVANSSTGNIIAIPFEPSGAAGTARVHATLPVPQGCDEFVFDVHGSLYCTTDPFNTVVRLDPDGGTEILLTQTDGLDGPTSAAFGRRGQNRKNLYITNAAFPMFSTTFRPSLMRLRLHVPGAP